MVELSQSVAPPCRSCGQAMQEYLLPVPGTIDRRVAVWGCERCGEVLPARPPETESASRATPAPGLKR